MVGTDYYIFPRALLLAYKISAASIDFLILVVMNLGVILILRSIIDA